MKAAIVFLSLFLALACNRAAAPIANSSPHPINVAQQSNEAQSVLAHSSEGQPPKSMNANAAGPAKSSPTGDPIDTTKFDAKIKDAEKDVKAKPEDETAKKALAEAFFERGFALTQARQYASALGDYRRALKYDPDHEESKNWIDQIVSIYAMLKKDPPAEGKEPAALPFKKEG
jgi:tetratricopeptide (TPR) repeat protein